MDKVITSVSPSSVIFKSWFQPKRTAANFCSEHGNILGNHEISLELSLFEGYVSFIPLSMIFPGFSVTVDKI